jgi:hypothetical protein
LLYYRRIFNFLLSFSSAAEALIFALLEHNRTRADAFQVWSAGRTAPVLSKLPTRDLFLACLVGGELWGFFFDSPDSLLLEPVSRREESLARVRQSEARRRVKSDLSDRVRQIRETLYGERGGPAIARDLGVPTRTWYNYESSVTIPAEILLRFLLRTNANPQWLLDGSGPQFRPAPGEAVDEVESLVETAESLRDALNDFIRKYRSLHPRDAGNGEPRSI